MYTSSIAATAADHASKKGDKRSADEDQNKKVVLKKQKIEKKVVTEKKRHESSNSEEDSSSDDEPVVPAKSKAVAAKNGLVKAVVPPPSSSSESDSAEESKAKVVTLTKKEAPAPVKSGVATKGESRDSDDSSEDDEEAKVKVVTPTKKAAPTAVKNGAAAEEESSDSDHCFEDYKKKPATKVTAKSGSAVVAKKKEESSDDNEPKVKVVALTKNTAPTPVKNGEAAKEKSSDSDDSSKDEKKKPATKVDAKNGSLVVTKKKEESSDSVDSVSSKDEHKVKVVALNKKVAPASVKNGGAASNASKEESSDNDDCFVDDKESKVKVVTLTKKAAPDPVSNVTASMEELSDSGDSSEEKKAAAEVTKNRSSVVAKKKEESSDSDDSVSSEDVECKRNGWIDKLPCDVQSYILSFLTIKDAVHSCMISHQWRHLWKHPILTRSNIELDIPNVFGGKHLLEDIDMPKPRFSQIEKEFFVRYVNEFLLLYRGEEVDSFRVAFYLDATYTAILDKCVSFAFEKGAEVLELKLLSRRSSLETENVYVFPHCFSELKSSTLKHLSLQNCVLEPPPPQFGRFVQLKTLCLKNAIVKPVFLTHLFSVCLLLESLTLNYCNVGSYLAIGPSLCLNDLKVVDCFKLERIEIDAVNLFSIECVGFHLQISCTRVPHLVRIFLLGLFKGSFPSVLSQLTSSPKLQTLHLRIPDDWEAIPQSIPTFGNLKQLYLDIYVRNFDLWSILNFLKAAPLLEELIIMARPLDYEEGTRNFPGFSHDHLRIFKMKGFSGKWIEIEFATCILRIATKLELLVIDPLGKVYYGDGKWSELKCDYEEGNEYEVFDEDEEEMISDLEDGVDFVDLQYLCWKQGASFVVRERLKEVMTDAQVIVL